MEPCKRFVAKQEVTINAIRVRVNNLAALVFTSALAYFWAFIMTNSVATPLGAPKLEAPLFSVVIVNLLLTWVISQFVVPLKTSPAAEAKVVKDATAIYVFSNGAGALTTTVTNLVEVIDLGRVTDQNAITVVLQYVYRDSPETWLVPYCVTVGTLAACALFFVWEGATALASRLSHSKEIGPVLGSLSGGLLAIAMLVGVSWNTLPGDTSAIASVWGITVYALIVLIATVLYGFLAYRTIRATIDLSIRGIVAGGKAITDVSLWLRLFRFFVAIFFGFAFATGAMLSVILALGCLLWVLSEVMNVSGLALEALYWIFPVFWSAFVFAIKALIVAVGFAVLAIASLFLLRRFPYMVSWGFRALATLFARVHRGSKRCLAATRQYVSIRLDQFRIPAGIRKQVLSLLGIISWPFRICVSWVRKHTPHALSASVAICLLAASSRYVSIPTPNEAPPDREDHQETSIEVDPMPLEPEVKAEPALPELEFVITEPFSFCDLSKSGVDWAYASTDSFAVSLDVCDLSEEIKDGNKSIVFVGVSSPGFNKSLEEKRAYQRGKALMEWAGNQGVPANQIYMLDLGMARHRHSMDYLFGLGVASGSRRPAVALSLGPYPAEATLDESALVTELNSRIRPGGVQQQFSKCDLYAFKPLSRAADGERKVATLNCSSSR